MPTISFIGSILQCSTIVFCVVSIWLPGSPFSLSNEYFKTDINNCISNNLPTTSSTKTNLTMVNKNEEDVDYYFLVESLCVNYTSIVVLLTGIALSRFGLWLTDLAIHQAIQETVPARKRGAIAGAQSSLNYAFDTIKYAAVIFLSDIAEYGYLVMISTLAVLVAFGLNLIYTIVMCVKRSRGESETDNDNDDDDEDENVTDIEQQKQTELKDIEITKQLN